MSVASFQEAVVEVLVEKALAAAQTCGRTRIAMSGGVSSNGRLQALASERSLGERNRTAIARRELRTDNAAMIAYVAALQRAQGVVGCLDAEVMPSIDFEVFGRVAA